MIAGSGTDDLGGLRPGRDRACASQGLDVAPASMLSVPSETIERAPSAKRPPYGWAAAIIIVGLGVSAFHLPDQMRSHVRGLADRLAVVAGFGVDHIAVVGHNHTSMADIVRVLDLNKERSLLGYDATEVRSKVKRLPWVETARVVHILPDTMSIEIQERQPFAIWQYNGKHFLVDRNGNTLMPFSGSVHESEYALVVGRGAEIHARSFLELLALYPEIKKKTIAAVRVADRRWNIALSSGKKVLLPESGVRGALGTLKALLASNNRLATSVSSIDLRIPARPTLRLASGVDKALRDRKDARRAAALLLAGGRS